MSFPNAPTTPVTTPAPAAQPAATPAPAAATPAAEPSIADVAKILVGASPAAPQDPAAPVEPPKAPEPEKKEDKFAPKFAALSKKERELQKREKAVDEREKKVNDTTSNWDSIRATAKENVGEALDKIGLTYEEITEWHLSGKLPDSAKIRDMERQQKADRERKQKVDTDKQAAEEQRKIDDHRSQIAKDVQALGDRFELINHFGQHGLVYDVILQKFVKDGVVMPTDEAADLVENYLDREWEKSKSVKKLASKFAPAPTPAPTGAPKPEETNPAGTFEVSKTLTKAQSTTVTEPDSEDLSDAERLARATRLLSSG